jgi:tryptophan 6-halogenase
LDVWFRRGDLAAELARQGNPSHFGNASWHCLLAGYGAFPAVSKSARDDIDFYTTHRVDALLEGCSLNFDSHADVLSRLSQA